MNYWNQSMECMEREELQKVQLSRLKQTIYRVYKNVPFYRDKMQRAGISPDDIRTLDDLKLLPFSVKKDLRDTYPYGLFAAPLSEIVRIHASSGTTGKPIVVGYTQKDIDTWAELAARCLVAAGADREAIVQVSYGYGLFTGGLGIHYGAEKLGAMVVPAGGGNTRRQLMLMKDLGVTCIACTPSYALHMGEVIAADPELDLKDFKLKHGIFGGEPWTDGMRQRLEESLGITACDIYGLSEAIGPGVAIECDAHKGLHIFEDHFIPEIIDPDSGEVKSEGTGELVLTSITKEGFPVIRYRTRDLTTLHYEKCECGRTHVRMERVLGRSDDMLIIRGVNVFPSQVESVLTHCADVQPHYLLVVDRNGTMDTLEIQVEMADSLFSDEVRKIESVRRAISAEIESVLGISATLRLVEPGSIERSQGKTSHILDRRVL